VTGRVIAVCTSARTGDTKEAVAAARLRVGHGIEGDAHAGHGHRQVSILAAEDVEEMRARGLPDLSPGAFGENLVVAAIDLGGIGIGSRLAVGSAELMVTQIGKQCHSRCHIYHRAGDCIMPRAGLFAAVTGAGEIRAGDRVEALRLVGRDTCQAAVVTVSDRCARSETTDTAGPAVATRLVAALAVNIAWSGVVPDREDRIAALLDDLAGRGLDLVLTTGGTGLGPRDVTPEATRSVIEREAPGLAEAMRSGSAALTPLAWLSRAVCGVRGRTLICNLPGSEKGAVENLESLLPLLPHALSMLRGDGHPAADAGRHAAAREDTP
jgi:molybdopterin adenylyltransferase